ncbi:MAG: hypothetical protein K2L80_05265 [Muribaculaceae bacterium]|nr:hypothetical protein [Muribaculaceae bacterium]
MNRFSYILAALMSLCLFCACGDDDHFKVSGTIEGNPTFNMRFHYYGDESLHTGITASREGKFMFTGSSREPVMVEIYDNDYHVMGRFYARNGDDIKCVLNQHNPYMSKIEGNDVNRRLSEFSNANAAVLLRPGADANRIIAGYIKSNPADIVSARLLVGSFDASSDMALADSLLHLLEPGARPANFIDNYEFLMNRVSSAEASQPVLPVTFVDAVDSIRTFNPRHNHVSIIVLSDSRSGRSDSILPELKKIYGKYDKKKLAVLDFSVDTDTATWKQSIRSDSAGWIQGWAAGSLAAPAISRLGARRIPYFIVADSAGKQIYRGVSLGKAISTAESNL